MKKLNQHSVMADIYKDGHRKSRKKLIVVINANDNNYELNFPDSPFPHVPAMDACILSIYPDRFDNYSQVDYPP